MIKRSPGSKFETLIDFSDILQSPQNLKSK